MADLRDFRHQLMSYFAQAPNGMAKSVTRMLEYNPFLRERCPFSNLYSLFSIRYITDSVPAMFVALLLFVLPAHKPKCIGWNTSTSDSEQTEEGI